MDGGRCPVASGVGRGHHPAPTSTAPTDFDPQPVWDEWNAKDPDAQAADVLTADAALLARLAQLTPDEVATLRFAMGPMELDVPRYVGMRLNEHAVHTWDVAVTFDDTATIPPEEAGLIVDTLAMMAGFAGKPTGTERTLTVHTVAPERTFEIALRADGVALSPQPPVAVPDLELSGDTLGPPRLRAARPGPHSRHRRRRHRARRATKGVPGLLILARGAPPTVPRIPPSPDEGRPFPSGHVARRRPDRRSNLAAR